MIRGKRVFSMVSCDFCGRMVKVWHWSRDGEILIANELITQHPGWVSGQLGELEINAQYCPECWRKNNA